MKCEICSLSCYHHHHHHYHHHQLSLNREGRWGTTDDFTTSFFHFIPCSPLPSGTWRTPGLSTPWCCLPTSSSDCFVLFFLSLCLARWFWPDLMNTPPAPSFFWLMLFCCWFFFYLYPMLKDLLLTDCFLKCILFQFWFFDISCPESTANVIIWLRRNKVHQTTDK